MYVQHVILVSLAVLLSTLTEDTYAYTYNNDHKHCPPNMTVSDVVCDHPLAMKVKVIGSTRTSWAVATMIWGEAHCGHCNSINDTYKFIADNIHTSLIQDLFNYFERERYTVEILDTYRSLEDYEMTSPSENVETWLNTDVMYGVPLTVGKTYIIAGAVRRPMDMHGRYVLESSSCGSLVIEVGVGDPREVQFLNLVSKGIVCISEAS